MTCAEAVIGTFGTLGESAYTMVLSEPVKIVLPAGKDLMGISLMSNVPDYLILGKIKCSE